MSAPSPPSSALRLDGLTKRFGSRTVVDGLSFELPFGGVVGFLGPNGSGKSTTIRMLLGLIRPTAGTAEVLGLPISSPAAYTAKVGALVDSPALYPTLTGHANLAVHAELARLPRTRIDEVLEIVDLRPFAQAKVKTYSLGMRQRLAIAVTLLRDPPLLLLDEPTNGLDPAGIVEIRALLMRLGANGHSVFVSSHVLAEMQAACDRYVVIRNGELLFSGTSDELIGRSAKTVTAIPQRVDDLGRMADHIRRRGWSATLTDRSVVIEAESHAAAQINQACFDVGVVLRELRVGHEDLEDVFLAMVDVRKRAVPAGVAR